MSASQPPRPELAAQFFRLSRVLMAAEAPILAANGLDMWGYVVLSVLHRTTHPAPTQLELARLTGRDKTRLIGNLDSLERAGLVTRQPDQSDRRAKNIEITAAGRARVLACQEQIRAMEDAALVGAAPADQLAFFRVLDTLSTSG